MSEQWQYQLRVYLSDELAEVARSDHNNSALKPLTDILNKHHAALVSQFDAFENYVAEAEREGPENFPLYKWTKATVDNPVKRAKHIKTFALHVSGNEIYGKHATDALEADLQSSSAASWSRGYPDTTRTRRTICRCPPSIDRSSAAGCRAFSMVWTGNPCRHEFL